MYTSKSLFMLHKIARFVNELSHSRYHPLLLWYFQSLDCIISQLASWVEKICVACLIYITWTYSKSSVTECHDKLLQFSHSKKKTFILLLVCPPSQVNKNNINTSRGHSPHCLQIPNWLTKSGKEFQGSFKSVLRKLQGYFKKVSRVFKGKLNGTSKKF